MQLKSECEYLELDLHLVLFFASSEAVFYVSLGDLERKNRI